MNSTPRHYRLLGLLLTGAVVSLVTGCPVVAPGQMSTQMPGPTGPAGASGASGVTGSAGAEGSTGATGETGIQGGSTVVVSASARPTSAPSRAPSISPSPSPSPSPSIAPSPSPSASVPTVAAGPAPVPMSDGLKKFAVLAGSTVTNSGPSVVTGDLGVSPGTQLVGFDTPGGPGTLNGNKQVGNPTAAQAKADLMASFNDAKGRAGPPISRAGNLGGQTLAPGLYNSQTSLAVSSGDLTLDAKGDANAVWIFQMGSTLTTTSGRQVILSGGAKAKNVYWQVGSSATLGTTSVFKGNILAAVSITLNTGAKLEGRALTQSGAVALNASTVTNPSD